MFGLKVFKFILYIVCTDQTLRDNSDEYRNKWDQLQFLLMLCMLDKKFNRQKFELFFLFFPENRVICADCLPRRHIAWTVKPYFLEKKREKKVWFYSQQ